MSGLLSAAGSALSALQALTGSRSRLLPASFRGVPFYVVTGGGAGGRRLVTHEFPLRDNTFTEDLGRLPRRFKLTAFVIDDDGGAYLDYRDALIAAIEGFSTAATLVHPTFGPVSVRAGVLGWSERIVEEFGFCEFQLDFVQDGPQPSPTFGPDAASALLGGVASMLPLLSAAYETVVQGIVSPASLLADAGDFMLGLPPGTIQGLQNAVAAIGAAPGDATATAAAVQTVAQAMAANVIAAAATAAPSDDPVAGTTFAVAPPADVSGGLAGLASWGATLAPVTGLTAVALQQAAQQAAVAALVEGNAVAALAQVYATVDWPYADAATAARQQLLGLLDAQTDAAADAGNDDLYRGWRALTALAMGFMISEAQSLPALGYYTLPDGIPSLVLAQFLYADPSQAPVLEQLNDVEHPLFMAPNGTAIVLPGTALAAVAPVPAQPVTIPPDYLTLEFIPLTDDSNLLVMR